MNHSRQIVAKRVDSTCDAFIVRSTGTVFLLTWTDNETVQSNPFTLWCNGVRRGYFSSRRVAIGKMETLAK